jgi:hypothetical protein
MPILIQQIKGEILKNVVDNILYVSTIKGDIQKEDYINLNGLVAYVQNLSNTEETYSLNKPINFGLVDTYNKTVITLEINY